MSIISSTRVRHRFGRGDEMQWSPWIARTPADNAWRTIIGGGWNEKEKWMWWARRNGGIKFVAGEKERNPEKNLGRLRFVKHETHIEWPKRELGTSAVGSERLTACVYEHYFFLNPTILSNSALRIQCKLLIINLKLKPWRYSSEEPRQNEAVAARWQYRRPCS